MRIECFLLEWNSHFSTLDKIKLWIFLRIQKRVCSYESFENMTLMTPDIFKKKDSLTFDFIYSSFLDFVDFIFYFMKMDYF